VLSACAIILRLRACIHGGNTLTTRSPRIAVLIPCYNEVSRSLTQWVVTADTAQYDADHLRQAIAAKSAIAVIPNNPSRALKYPLDKHLYARRHLVEWSP